MIEIPDSLQTVFTGTVERRGDRYVVEIPDREVSLGSISPGVVYRIALLGDRTVERDDRSPPLSESGVPEPPVSEGERRTVTVEAVGSEGDGIAKVERGYVVIVPGGEPDEQVEVEIERVTPTVAFATVVDDRGV